MRFRFFKCTNCKETIAVSASWNDIQSCPICAYSKAGAFKHLGTRTLKDYPKEIKWGLQND